MEGTPKCSTANLVRISFCLVQPQRSRAALINESWRAA